MHRKITHARELPIRQLGVLAVVAITCGGLATVGGTAEAAGTVAVTCPTVSASKVVTPAPAPGVDWAGCNLGWANLTGADLAGANLDGASLANATLTGADIVGANLSGADLEKATLANANINGVKLTGANLTGTNFGAINGSPASLPAGYFVVTVPASKSTPGNYLAGPGAYLYQVDFSGQDLPKADLAGADLGDANLWGVTLWGSDLAGADLSNANLTSANLSRADAATTNFFGANLTSANLDYADLDYATLVATVTGTTAVGATEWGTVCPDGRGSGASGNSCLPGADTTPPVVTVTGVSNGKTYVTGGVPKAGCKTTTTDNAPVYKAATLKVTTSGRNGVGRFTATCSGAVAGNEQKAPVSVTYTVVYGLHGFIAPANGATIARSSGTITVRFRLTNASGAAISATVAKALAAAHDVRATLQGPGIRAVIVNCGWNASQQDLTCAIRIPSGVRTGSSQRYTITATENVSTAFRTVPGVRGAADPEVIHFR